MHGRFLIVGLAAMAAFAARSALGDTVTMDATAAAAANVVATTTDHQVGSGAWQANGASKAEIYLTPQALFGRAVAINEIASLKYFTKKAGAQGSPDWYVNVYTMPFTGGDSSWYGYRLGLEPIYANSPNAPAGQWNQWSTDAGTNQLTVHNAPRTNMGFYGGPTLADLTAGSINWGAYPNSGSTAVVNYSGETIKYIVLSTGNPWCNGFTGLVDALEITLTGGASVLVDLESKPAVWVDDDFNSSTPGWGVTRFAAIANAVAAVDAGGTINVAAGSYVADNVVVNKAVTVQGAGDTTVFSAGANLCLFTVTASGVTFRDVAFQLPAVTKRAFFLSGGPINGFTVENVAFSGGDRGIEVQANPVNGLAIRNCRFSDVRYGMRSASFVLVDGFEVTGCTFEGGPATDADNNAIAIYQSSDGGAGLQKNVTIANNVFRNLNPDIHPGSGVYFEEVQDAVIENNVFENCFRGFYIYKAYNATRPVSNVVVRGNTFRACANSGIELRNYSGFGTVTIEQNAFVGNARGIRAHGDGAGWSSLTIAQNSFAGNSIEGVGVLTGYEPAGQELGGARLNARNNWWGIASGPGPVGPGQGDKVNALVDYDPWIGKPTQANVLFLEPEAASVYVKPTESVIVNMNVANLSEPVAGCQALLNFSSSFFKAGTGEVNVVAGGGAWNELIYSLWNVAGDLDVAVGVSFSLPAGTQADANIAKMTLAPTGTEGTTRVIFRDDGEAGYATMLSSVNSEPIYPAKIDSINIVIDGTAPAITAPDDATVTAAQYTMEATATDDRAGIESFTMNGTAFTSPTQITLVPGTNTFTFVATDRAGNVTTEEVVITYNQAAPAITVYHAIAPSATAGQSSWNAWLANELDGVLNNNPGPIGSGHAVWQTIPSGEVDYAASIVSRFNSWMGLITSDLEWGNRATYVYKLDNGVQTNPGAAKLNLDKINITWKWNYAASDSNPADEPYDFSYSWLGKPGTFAAGVQRLKGYNFVGDQWVEVTSGREADMIIYNNGEAYEPESATPPKPATQATLNELYKQMCGSIAFAGSNREKVADSNFVVTYSGQTGVAEASSGDVGFKYKTVDATAPVVTISVPAADAKFNNASLEITGTATDNETLASGIRRVEIKLNGTQVYLNTAEDNVSFAQAVTLAEGSNAIEVIATDFAGNITTATRTVLLDTAAPTIGNLAAVQMRGSVAVNVLNCANPTLQGTVQISVAAADASAGLVVLPPVVTVTNGSEPLTVTYVDQNPAGTFNYTVDVVAETANGDWTITATATDEAGNNASTSGTLCVNKNQVTGTISFATMSSAAYSVTRDVVLVATDSAGAALKTWTVPVQFTNSSGTASGTYTLTDVPAAMANLSADTAWDLRTRQAVAPDENGQTDASFTLRGGDIKADNFVNILDYSMLKSSWGTSTAAADINGDGQVQTLDYAIQKANWFVRGDAQ